MTPRDSLEIAILLERASRRSLQVRLIARTAPGAILRWRARFVFASVDARTFCGTPIPKSWRGLIDRELALAVAAGPLDAWDAEPGAAAAGSRRPGHPQARSAAE
jgi:hypothetical protein